MSNSPAIPWLQAKTVADGLVRYLQPFCQRIELAGSIRRRKPLVHDIEIVAIPKMDADLFGNPLDTSAIDHCFDGRPVTFLKRGPRYWQFQFAGNSGHVYTTDLFLQPDPLTWPVNFLLRTGSAEFSHKMVTPQSAGGFKPSTYQIRDARIWRNGVALQLHEEEEIFELWGMSYVEPHLRHIPEGELQ